MMQVPLYFPSGLSGTNEAVTIGDHGWNSGSGVMHSTAYPEDKVQNFSQTMENFWDVFQHLLPNWKPSSGSFRSGKGAWHVYNRCYKTITLKNQIQDKVTGMKNLEIMVRCWALMIKITKSVHFNMIISSNWSHLKINLYTLINKFNLQVIHKGSENYK